MVNWDTKDQSPDNSLLKGKGKTVKNAYSTENTKSYITKTTASNIFKDIHN